MSDNLFKVERNLKSIAKRYKTIKYSLGLAILFLMMGSNAFTEEVATRQTIQNSVGSLQTKINILRSENEKQLKGLRLELVQLMEQGDQVIKSPWSSWQFGIGYSYSKWSGKYKGRSDKEREILTPFKGETLLSKYVKSEDKSSRYGLTDLDLESTYEPNIEITVNAGVKIKNVSKRTPNINLQTVNSPNSPRLNISLQSPGNITTPTVNSPNINYHILEPNADPFSQFYISPSYPPGGAEVGYMEDGVDKDRSFLEAIDITKGTFWSGVKPNGEIANEAGFSNPEQDTTIHNAANFDGKDKIYNGRYSGIYYTTNGRNMYDLRSKDPFYKENIVSGGKYYVAGDLVSASNDIDVGTSIFNVDGATLTLKNIEANLYGRAAVLYADLVGSLINLENVKINVIGDNNTIFCFSGSSTDEDTNDRKITYYPKFKGNANVTINSQKNTVFTTKWFGGLKIINEGDIIFNGASNIGVSFLAYVPNRSKYIANLYPSYKTDSGSGNKEEKDFIPELTFTKPLQMYGDENVGVFFGEKFMGSWYANGIYQGKLNLSMEIGKKLNSGNIPNTDLTQQISTGQLTNDGYTPKTVDACVGIFVQTGQREGVTTLNNTEKFIVKDPVHNLYLEKLKIAFGKYSNKGFMILAKNGTVIEVLNTVEQTEFSDGIDGKDTTENDIGKGTVIIYSEGKWKTTYRPWETYLEKYGYDIKGKPTEVIVDKKLHMMSREGIAFFGKNSGKVTVKKDAKAYAYGSIMAYTENGTIDIGATINATDDLHSSASSKYRKEKYRNIGAYAKATGGKNSVITINGNATINGIGALAEGEGAKIYLKGTGNSIKTGIDGGLIAKNKAEIEFHGGTIINKDNSTDRGLTENDHKNTTPFYATDDNAVLGTTKGKIIFNATGSSDTNIHMYDGVLVHGKAGDYSSASSPIATAKYQGMEKVKVTLMGNGVNLGVFEGLNGVVWEGNSNLTAYTNKLNTIPKFGNLNPNGKSFKSTLIAGTLSINSNVNLTNSSDKFNGISMERELVTINSGKTVIGNGKGLSMGSNFDAISNSESGYINKGTVNITGGTSSSGVVGINVSYGKILNDNGANIKVDNGAGLYGTNGSKLENKGNITLTGTGQGMIGISRATGTGAPTYGGNSVEIINEGNIAIAGNNSIGIYAENNSNTSQNNITIKNKNKIKVGDNGVGIALKSTNSSTKGGVITTSGTGTSDIVVGKNGVGLYAENSIINITSDYEIQAKDNGVGIYTTGNSSVVSNKTLKYKYIGSSNGNGIATLYAGINPINNFNIILNNVTNGTSGMVGIFAKGGGNLINSGNITGTSKNSEFGIVTDNNTNVVNSGNISLGNANDLTKGNVGIYVKTRNKITNTGDIIVGNNSIALYGYGISHTIGNLKVGDNGIALYSQGGNISLTSGSIQIGKRESVGVFTTGVGQNIISKNSISIGETSYGFVMKGKNYNLQTENPDVILKGDSVFAYSDVEGTMENKTKLNSVGNQNYGLYSAGIIKNSADINFGTGVGNVGIYSISYTDSIGKEIAGKASNGVAGFPLSSQPKITVSKSDDKNKIYGIGMAAGYADETGFVKRIGQIENFGTIEVFEENGIGMYAVGSGSKAINHGVINLSGKKTVGMYLDHNAVGENYGVIKTIPNSKNDGIIGVVALNGAILKNYGKIIIDSANGIGFYSATNGQYQEQTGGSIKATGTDSRDIETAIHSNTGKEVKGIKIVAPPGTINAKIIRNNQIVSPTSIDTNIASSKATQIKVGSTILDLSALKTPDVNLGQASTLGMYIDTSGIRYTNPIQGLHHLSGLKRVNLMIGSEASLYTNVKDIEIGQNILKPYNDSIIQVSSRGSGNVKWVVNSANLTWIATVTQNPDFTIAKLYISKIPYTSFAKDSDTYNFMQGLEDHYSNASGKDKEIFNKLNALGKQEAQVFAQAVDEMRGKQYANIQQRVNTTGNILDKEFKNLRTEKNMSKDSNKIKTFGAKGEYKTDTAGIVDYKYNTYGVAYVHENEDIKLGKGIGWYTGIVHNKFKFKDIGKSKEEQLQTKLGIFKSRPYDDNNSLNWTTSAEIFVGYNRMDRKFLVVDEIYQAKSKYYTYGIGIRNEVSKEYRLSEDFRLKPYAALKLEYGRVSKIKEKNGEIKLEVKSNDYISIKPEIGTELAYRHYFGVKTLNTSIGIAYENELGKVANGKNKAKVSDTNADWFTIRGEKEDRKGNVKFDLNVGFDNQRFGITGNVGYDTKGSNIRGGLGLRVIF